jgi:hypothetical protein
MAREWAINRNLLSKDLSDFNLQIGDISLNPGPIKYPCGKCYKPVAKNHRALYCGKSMVAYKVCECNTTRIQRFRTEQWPMDM